MINLQGRRLLVTGAASGIGRATVALAIESGATVAAFDCDEEGLAGLPPGCVQTYLLNLTETAAIPVMVERAINHLGGLEGLVNCAGIHLGLLLDETSETDWVRSLTINLSAPFLICQAAAQELRKSRGAIVNVASGAGLVADAPRSTAYAASKGGLIALTKALAAELAPYVRANVVCPGLTATPMTAHMLEADPQSRERALARYALGRAAEPEEIARVILFLLSEEASFVTGATVAADGGRTFH